MPSLEIGERMIQVVPAMTGLIDRLEKQSLVRRERCLEDRRVIYIVLTEQGTELLAKLDKPVEELHKDLLGHMAKTELTELSRLLEKARLKIQLDGE